jgi:hypothetical protein
LASGIVPHAELVHRVTLLTADRANVAIEFPGDFRYRVTFGKQSDDLDFPRRKRQPVSGEVRFGARLRKRRDERCAYVASADTRVAHGCCHELDRLGLVDQPHRACVQDGTQDRDIAYAGQHNDAGARMILPYPANEPESVFRIQAMLRHRKVRDEHIARNLGELSQQGSRIICLADDVYSVVGIKQRLHS